MLLSHSFGRTTGLRPSKHVWEFCLQLCEYYIKTNKLYNLFVVKMTSHNRLDDSSRWKADGRLQGGHSQAEVALWSQVARK
ncbi:hypothetical protein TNCV_2454241 [Trichonephila clavipes]|nr:hypothetical protein TNCV_2454241 [Trichonephila clavipes]